MPTNVLLVRWKEGWHEVVDAASVAAHPRHEAYLALGALQSLDEVNRVAGMQLSVIAHPRMAIAADLDPMGLWDRPYRGFNVGDIITVPAYGSGTTGQRVRSITGAEDDNGEVTYSPELGDLILEEHERTLLAIKKMIDGTLDGQSAVAQPTRSYQAPTVARPVPRPEVVAEGFKISSGGPFVGEYVGVSDSYSAGDGGGTYTLVAFRCTVPETNLIDGLHTFFRLLSSPGDSGTYTCASIDLGLNHAGGSHTGTILIPEVQIGSGWSVWFEGGGMWGGPFSVEAVFAELGEDVTLDWYPQGT